jgi:hypothetical protein
MLANGERLLRKEFDPSTLPFSREGVLQGSQRTFVGPPREDKGFLALCRGGGGSIGGISPKPRWRALQWRGDVFLGIFWVSTLFSYPFFRPYGEENKSLNVVCCDFLNYWKRCVSLASDGILGFWGGLKCLLGVVGFFNRDSAIRSSAGEVLLSSSPMAVSV